VVAQAAGLGLSGIGICDRNSLSGVVRAYAAARDLQKGYPGFRLVVGARIVFADGSPDVAVYPTDRPAYGRLAALLTIGNRRAPKGQCHLELADLVGQADGQLMIVIPRDGQVEHDVGTAQLLAHGAQGRVWLAASPRFDGRDRARLNRLAFCCTQAGLPMLATMEPLYHEPGRSIIQDVLTCVRELTTIFDAGFRLAPNAERFIRHPEDMRGLFQEHPGAIAETSRFIERISFTLDELKYIYPEETVGNGETAQQTLERLAQAGAASRYPLGIPEKVLKGLEHELALIAEMKYAAYPSSTGMTSSWRTIQGSDSLFPCTSSAAGTTAVSCPTDTGRSHSSASLSAMTS
jgi:DNA polymerase III alpha subunit